MKTLKVLIVIAAVYSAAYGLLGRYRDIKKEMINIDYDRADWNKVLQPNWVDYEEYNKVHGQKQVIKKS